MNTDYALDDDLDLKFVDGDFAIVESDPQHVEAIVLLHQGELREFPNLGFGASRFIKASEVDATRFKSELKTALKLDGYRPQTIDVSKGFGDFEIVL